MACMIPGMYPRQVRSWSKELADEQTGGEPEEHTMFRKNVPVQPTSRKTPTGGRMIARAYCHDC